MEILRAVDRRAVPWKNGGGVTYEVRAAPGSAGFDFDWRLSVAHVRKSGSFSLFPHIDRKLAIVKGRMRLTVDGQRSSDLVAQSCPISFDGNSQTFAEVVEAVTDVNLMTRRDRYSGTLEWIILDRELLIYEEH